MATVQSSLSASVAANERLELELATHREKYVGKTVLRCATLICVTVAADCI